MRGRGGNDTYIVDHSAEKVVELAGEGTDRIKSSVTFTLPDHVEQLVLSGNDRINGTGNGEDNLLVGNRAPNVLRGGAGADTLRGADGGDRLYGGKGSDVLEGGDGYDRFYFDAALGSSNVDLIMDFLRGVDRIVLENAVFEGLGGGALSASAFALGSAAATAAHRILYDAATHALFFDPDGVGGAAAIQFAEFADPPPTLAASDFLVI
jgi:Ca2+-binding RTX toxin-like protein